MELYQLILIICAAAIVGLALIFFLLALISYKFAFGSRADKNPLLKYFTAEDFNLGEEKFQLGKLCGCIYENKAVESKAETVVFAHGMGPGHCAYMTEIAYFCNLGYTVVAVDSLGCGISQGKNLGGMYEGVKTAIAAVNFAKRKFAGNKVYLVGHSWGGYSSLAATAVVKVDKVVAIGAPLSPAKTLRNGAENFIGKPLAAILSPFWYIINFLKYGAKGNAKSAKAIDKSGVPALLIHGDSDSVVKMKNSAFGAAKGANVEKFLAEGKAHNPYNTVAAETKLKELTSVLANARKTPKDELKVFCENFDFKAATEEDGAVMQKITEFLK